MQPEHWDENKYGPLTETNMERMLMDRGYRVTCYVYPPGTYFPPHTHNVDKIDGVIAGRFRMEMEGASVVLEAGDTLVVPKGMVHSAAVVGDEPVVSLDAVCVSC